MDYGKIWEKEFISSDSYGNVYKALNKDTGNYVAIKEINKININHQLIYLMKMKLWKK